MVPVSVGAHGIDHKFDLSLKSSGVFDLQPIVDLEAAVSPVLKVSPASVAHTPVRTAIAVSHSASHAEAMRLKSSVKTATLKEAVIESNRFAPKKKDSVFTRVRRVMIKHPRMSASVSRSMYDGGTKHKEDSTPVQTVSGMMTRSALLRRPGPTVNAAAMKDRVPNPDVRSFASVFASSFSPRTPGKVIAGLRTLFSRKLSSNREREKEEESVVQINEWTDYLDLALKGIAFLTFMKPFLAWEMVLTGVVLKGDLDLKRYAHSDPSKAKGSMRKMFLWLAGLMAVSLGAGALIPELGSWGGVLFPSWLGLGALLLSSALEAGISAFDLMAARRIKDPVLADEAKGKLVDGTSTMAAAIVVLLATLFAIHSWWLEAVPVIVLIAISLMNAWKLRENKKQQSSP